MIFVPYVPYLPREENTLSDFAFYFVFLGLVLYLFISGSLLVTWEIPYDIPGGSPFSKFHPGTYCIAIGFVLSVIGKRSGRSSRSWTTMLWFTSSTVIAAIYVLIRFGPNGSGFLVDTLIAPGLLGTVLLASSPEQQRYTFRFMVVVLFFNAIIGILEVITQARVIPYLVDGEPMVEEYFRSTAFGGHPLSNFQRTTQILLSALVYEDRRQFFLIPVFYLGLLAFGSRTAFLVATVLLVVWVLQKFFSDLILRKLDIRLMFFLILGAAAVVGLIALVISQGSIGGRIFAEFYWDESAQARSSAFKAFSLLRLESFLFGGGPELAESILDYLKSNHEDMAAIENFWILLTLHLGVIPLLLFAPSMLAMIYRLAWGDALALKLSGLSFLILASSTNSLASKSQSLALLVPMLIGARAELQFIEKSNSQ